MAGVRYLIRGMMDGAISTLGVVLGAFNPDVRIVVAAGVAGALANGVSNVIAAFTAEYTRRYQSLRELEESVLGSLEGTVHEKNIRRKVYRDALYDGISSILGGVIPVIPFFFLHGHMALLTAIGVCCVLMGVLGIGVGYLTKKSLILSFMKLIAMTLFTAFVCYFIGSYIQRGPLTQ